MFADADWRLGQSANQRFPLNLDFLMIALIAGQHWGNERYGGSEDSGRAAFDEPEDSLSENCRFVTTWF